ncbi:hypothetical protein N7499_010761 [Penicillium canescens]|uniref:Uncharacterized protein n=1 Tax=Penicillium canescens TaxID=5083 RepID=A0AAD6IIY6_PENCN|nr:uncharacterized protein N7446_006029 [Penicillium canescens]KAJ6051397.1 hypothetical protein N7460_001931 [Penicillium canescens]KAJ6061909.1 hypothetical protein N7446_006029 [Penicillium canescens]KAJ6065159.1 hypothetical protein N7444_000812 [Penicillium canescens]KAJ6068874.1 hypothetical protein N7499_010761 [Penicillium canescens]KAJ6183070.1 hypothetical protein N7485_001712 [Penicillium canescens]
MAVLIGSLAHHGSARSTTAAAANRPILRSPFFAVNGIAEKVAGWFSRRGPLASKRKSPPDHHSHPSATAVSGIN